jgi:hypothetical protein
MCCSKNGMQADSSGLRKCPNADDRVRYPDRLLNGQCRSPRGGRVKQPAKVLVNRLLQDLRPRCPRCPGQMCRREVPLPEAVVVDFTWTTWATWTKMIRSTFRKRGETCVPPSDGKGSVVVLLVPLDRLSEITFEVLSRMFQGRKHPAPRSSTGGLSTDLQTRKQGSQSPPNLFQRDRMLMGASVLRVNGVDESGPLLCLLPLPTRCDNARLQHASATREEVGIAGPDAERTNLVDRRIRRIPAYVARDGTWQPLASEASIGVARLP